MVERFVSDDAPKLESVDLILLLKLCPLLPSLLKELGDPQLPKFAKKLVKKLLKIAGQAYPPLSTQQEATAVRTLPDDILSFFPAFSKIRNRGKYEADKTTVSEETRTG